MKTILFQGDSITDTCRKDEYICHLGMGYPLLVASRLVWIIPIATLFSIAVLVDTESLISTPKSSATSLT